ASFGDDAGLHATRRAHVDDAHLRSGPKRIGHRDHREDVPTRATAGEEDDRLAHACPPCKAGFPRTGDGARSSEPSRLREMLSKMPAAAAFTRSEEPP